MGYLNQVRSRTGPENHCLVQDCFERTYYEYKGGWKSLDKTKAHRDAFEHFKNAKCENQNRTFGQVLCDDNTCDRVSRYFRWYFERVDACKGIKELYKEYMNEVTKRQEAADKKYKDIRDARRS